MGGVYFFTNWKDKFFFKKLRHLFVGGPGAKFGPTLLKGDEAQAVARSDPENLKKESYLKQRNHQWKSPMLKKEKTRTSFFEAENQRSHQSRFRCYCKKQRSVFSALNYRMTLTFLKLKLKLKFSTLDDINFFKTIISAKCLWMKLQLY